MTDAELLENVKISLGITGTYQDNKISLHILEVKEYLADAGVTADIIASEKAIGIITRGASDLLSYEPGQGKLSEYFYQRAIQLKYQEETI
jgi:hypothetical protein